MFRAVSLSISQILSQPFRSVMLKAVGLTVAMLAAVWAALYGMFTYFVTVPWGWLDTSIEILTGIGILVGLGFLIAPVTSLFAGLFLDDVAEAVERTHYPHDAPGRPLPLAESIWSAVRFTALVVAVNLLVLLLLLLPGINIAAFFVANGYLLGREYFELAAGRFHSRERVAQLRSEHGGRVFAAGLLIAGVLAIPLVNLLTPLFATALMVHLHKRVMGSRPQRQIAT